MSVQAIDVEQFRQCVFFTLTVHKWGATAKVKDPLKYGDYLQQAINEARAKAERDGATPEEVLANAKFSLDIDAAAVRAALTGKAGNGKKVKTPTIAKPLVQSPALDALRAHLTDAKLAIVGPLGIAQPSGFLEGFYLCPASVWPQVRARINEAVARLTESWTDSQGNTRAGYLTAFLSDYAAAQERARTAPVLEGGLGPLYDAADYRPSDWVGEAFGLDYTVTQFTIPENLSEELKAEARERMNSQLRDARATCEQAMWATLGEFVDRLVERLTVQPGEKPPVFRDSLIGNIAAFCQVFDSKNIFGDAALKALVDRARELVAGVEPEKLRQYASVKEYTRAKFAEIQSALNAGLEERKGRRLHLDE